MRADIETFLSVVTESTAKTISNRIGLPQLDVAKELNRMHADGVLERGKRKGGGNEYVYWLSRSDAAKTAATADASRAVRAEPAASVPISVSRGDDLDAACAELDAARAQASAEAKMPQVEQADAAATAFAKLCGQTRELLDVLGLPPTMVEAIAVARTMHEIATATAIERDELRAEVESWRSANARLKSNNAALEQRIDELTLGPVGTKVPLFVTVGRYAKPKRHTSLEKAQKRGQALIRSEKESEVLVLEPVGRVVRGTEWVTR